MQLSKLPLWLSGRPGLSYDYDLFVPVCTVKVSDKRACRRRGRATVTTASMDTSTNASLSYPNFLETSAVVAEDTMLPFDGVKLDADDNCLAECLPPAFEHAHTSETSFTSSFFDTLPIGRCTGWVAPTVSPKSALSLLNNLKELDTTGNPT